MRHLLIFALMLVHSLSFATSSEPDLGAGRLGDILHVHHAPDPVNIRNGNFYLPIQDYYQPCFGFPLEVYRSYNSLSTRNGPFGSGWSFNYDLQIIVDEENGLRVVEADGFINDFVPVESEGENRTQDTLRIVDSKKKEDVKFMSNSEGKGSEFYATYQKKLETDDSFYKRQRERYLSKETKISKSGKYVSRKRGTIYMEKTKSGFTRTAETGRKEEYDARGLLTRITDRNNNELAFSYDSKSRLQRINDGCGQSLQFSYTASGKINEIRDPFNRKLTYQYDDGDRLTSSTEPNGEKTSFAYDKQGKMTSLTFGDGQKTDIEYDPKTSYVKKQTGPGKKITRYEYGKDGDKRWATYEDNEGDKARYEYIDSENKVTYIDKAGKKTITVVTACCGKPLSVKDDKGVGEEFRYDDKGNLISKVDSKKQTTTFSYEPRFNLLSEIKLHDGSALRFVYDGKANLTYLTTGAGEHVKLSYERHGKIEKMTNDQDHHITFAYNRIGKPTRIEKTMKQNRVGSIEIQYDQTGEIVKVDSDPKTPETIQNIKDTLAGFMRVLKPSGIDFEI